MGRPEVPAALSEIKSPTSIQDRIAALKRLKNDIIGHPLIKELVIKHGIAAPLVRNLQSSLKASGKRRSREVNGHGVALDKDHGWTHEDEMRLQTITIITSLAHGGPPLVGPLIAQGVLPPLLSALAPSTLPARLIVETLRAINVIVEADAIKFDPDRASLDDALEGPLFSKTTIESLAEILSQRGRSAAIHEQCTLTLKLISCSARSKKARQALVRSGILDILASKLAAFANEDLHHIGRSLPSGLLPPLLPRSSLPHLLDAITQIIRGSSYRSMRLICNKDISALFPIPLYSGSGSSTTATMNYLLPKLEAMQGRPARDIQKAFPALSCFERSTDTPPKGKLDTVAATAPRSLFPDEVVSPFEDWLACLARTTVRMERLAAVWLLGHLIPAVSKVCPEIQADLISMRSRERSLALLVVPVIVKMIEDATPKSGTSSKVESPSEQKFQLLVRERAPKALSKLIQDSSALQKAAVDAGAIKVLSQLLKKTFEPFTASQQSLWSPTSSNLDDDRARSVEVQQKIIAVTPEAMHAFQIRASALRAIATLGQKEDGPRKYIIEASVMQPVYDSLQPLDASIDIQGKSLSEVNPSNVLVAACKLITALSRSVSILRTSLIDARIAKPIFKLLKHPNIRVQLAATAAATNLVLNFSPMREELVNLEIVNVLCDHARSADPKLRINSLWALKHLVVNADHKLKCQCLETLGTGWLVQILASELRENGSTPKSHMATANAAGEQVDLLNAADEPSMDVDSELDQLTDEDDDMDDAMQPIRIAQNDVEMRRALTHRLRVIRESEENPSIKARNDDIRTQEQALDFIRNLIGEPGPGQHEMIEYLLLGFGATRIFELLTGKLKLRSTGSAQASGSIQIPRGPAGKQPKLSVSSTTGVPSTSRPSISNLRPSSTESSRDLWLNTPTDLVISTMFILIHIANGRPAHRHLLISQTPLMAALIPCFTHPDRRVRVACCWLVHNLTWQEDAADAGGARTRAMMLRDRGVEVVVRGLCNDDDLDTRERARGVGDVFRRLLDGGDGAMTGGFAGGAVGAGMSSSESRAIEQLATWFGQHGRPLEDRTRRE